MKPIPPGLRGRVIHAHDAEGQARGQITARFRFSASWIGKLLRRRREAGPTAARPHAGNRPRGLRGEAVWGLVRG